jgi:hypothetical protein
MLLTMKEATYIEVVQAIMGGRPTAHVSNPSERQGYRVLTAARERALPGGQSAVH